MNHKQILDGLSSFIDDELKPVERQAFESHISDCPSCKQALDEFQHIQSWARSYRPDSVPTDPWDELKIKLLERNNTRIGLVKWLYPRFAVAASIAILLGVVGILWILSPSPASDPAVQTVEFQIPRPTMDDATYSERLSALEQQLESVWSHLDPQTKEIVESNMLAIDEALERIHEALQEQPNSAILARLRDINRHQKLDLLQDLTSAS